MELREAVEEAEDAKALNKIQAQVLSCLQNMPCPDLDHIYLLTI